jgi:hypothetical protein
MMHKVINNGQTTATRAPQSQILQSQGKTVSNAGHGDSSGPLFTLYSKLAVEEDNKMVERWQKDAEGIIIFVCLGRPPYRCVLIREPNRPAYSLLS